MNDQRITDLGRFVLDRGLDGDRWMTSREVEANARLGLRSTVAILNRLHREGLVAKRRSDSHGEIEWADERAARPSGTGFTS